MKDGYFHGQGTYIWPNGGLIIEEWKNHNINGQATQIFGKNTEWAGDRYVGEYMQMINFTDKVHIPLPMEL